MISYCEWMWFPFWQDVNTEIDTKEERLSNTKGYQLWQDLCYCYRDGLAPPWKVISPRLCSVPPSCHLRPLSGFLTYPSGWVRGGSAVLELSQFRRLELFHQYRGGVNPVCTFALCNTAIIEIMSPSIDEQWFSHRCPTRPSCFTEICNAHVVK